MYTYGLLLNKSLEQQLDYRNGDVMFNLSKGLEFNGKFVHGLYTSLSTGH
jgi:hypothetical protein